MELDDDFDVDWPVRQGDLLGFWNWHTRPPLDRFGVIITADCDIEHGRPDQQLVYLRIIAQADYVDVLWSRSKLVNARTQALTNVVPQINRLRRSRDPHSIDLTAEEVEAWLASGKVADIVESIGVQDQRDRLRLVRNVEQTQMAITMASTPPGTSCFDHLLRFRNKQRHEILKQAANELQSARDEIFFLSVCPETY